MYHSFEALSALQLRDGACCPIGDDVMLQCSCRRRASIVACCCVQMAKHFVSHGGITTLIHEACKDAVSASTLTLICDILRLFVGSHTGALFAASVMRAINAMFLFKTPKNSDERELDVDVKHAALMLVQALHAAGDGRNAEALLLPEVRLRGSWPVPEHCLAALTLKTASCSCCNESLPVACC